MSELPEGMIFEEPSEPKRGRKSYVWKTLLDPVMQNPNQSVRVRTDFKTSSAASRAASALNKGRLTTPEGDGEWKFSSRTVKEEGITFYALYALYKLEKINTKQIKEEKTPTT